MSKSATLPRIRSKARPANQRPRLVEHELERAQQRIRTVDSLYSICLLAGGVLTYLLVIIALDYWLHLGDITRQILWSLAGIGALAFTALRIVYPLIQKINPYYTARMIEKSTPGSKNGIINWLDLRDNQISPVIRDALSRRAVHELDSANMEQAIPTRRPIQTGIIIGVILLVLLGVAFCLPDQVGSLFKRALFPFKPAIIPTNTRLEVLNPVEEPVPEVDVDTLPLREVTVNRGQPVEFRVLAHGQLPTEVFFESQAAGDKLPIVKPMRQDKKGEPTQPWRVALSSSDIPVDGFTFWFRANDGLTRKFKLVVVSRTPPSVSDIEVQLNYPAYTKRRPAVQGMGPIRAIEGTRVDLLVTADRAASAGELAVIEEQIADDGKPIAHRKHTIKLVRPQNVSDDNKLALAEPLWLNQNFYAKDEKKQKFYYQLALVSPDNLTGFSPTYPLDILLDLAPRVEIKKVKDTILNGKQDVFEVEANAVVPIAGQAHDDIAMDKVALKLKSSDGRDLFFVGQPPIEKNLQKANGFTPPAVDFLLTLDLTKLTYDDNPKTAKPIQLKPGSIIEAVVEGTDTAEPTPHVGTSQLIKFKIKSEASQEERKNQEKQAGDQQQQHDQKKKEREDQQPENQQNKNEDQNNKEKEDGNNPEKSKDNESGKNGNDNKTNKGNEKNNNKSKDQQNNDNKQKQKRAEELTKTQIEVISPTLEGMPDVDPETLDVRKVLTEQGHAVEFRVITHGQPADKVVMEYQQPGNQPVMMKAMQKEKSADTHLWRVTLPADELLPDGFTFWFKANDGQTRKFRLTLTNRPPPKADNFDVRLFYPAYTKRQSRSLSAGPIEAIVLTKAGLILTADRPVSAGLLEVIEEQTGDNGNTVSIHRQFLPLERLEAKPGEPQADNKLALAQPLHFLPDYIVRDAKKQKFTYRLSIVSADQQMGYSTRHTLKVLPDQVPFVEIQNLMGIALAKNQTEVEVAANAILPIGGIAQDDVAVRDITLKIRHADGRPLYVVDQEKPVRLNVQRPTGGIPPPVNFLFTIDLAKLSFEGDPAKARPTMFQVGAVLEIQVEATDSAEPQAHTGKSQVIKLKLKGKATDVERDDQANKAADMKDKDKEQQKKDEQKQQEKEKENDKNLAKDKEENKEPSDKGENQPGKQGENQPGKQGENQPGKQGENQPGKQGENQPGKQGENQPGKQGENQPGKQGENQPGKQGENQPGKQGENQPGKQGENQPGKQGENQPGKQGENQPGKQGENQPGKQGENQPGKQGENQPGKQGENQPGKQGENQPGKQGENQPGKQGENQPGKQGENQPGKQGDDKPGNDKGMAGGGAGTDPNDKGDLSKILEQVAKDDGKRRTDFNVKAAESKDDKKGQDIDANAARKRDLALDTLADKLRRGDIDRKLADKLNELKLTKEEALKMVQNQKLDRLKGNGRQLDQGPGKSLTSVKNRSEQISGPDTDVPDELASSYRTFTEKRNQQKK